MFPILLMFTFFFLSEETIMVKYDLYNYVCICISQILSRAAMRESDFRVRLHNLIGYLLKLLVPSGIVLYIIIN